MLHMYCGASHTFFLFILLTQSLLVSVQLHRLKTEVAPVLTMSDKLSIMHERTMPTSMCTAVVLSCWAVIISYLWLFSGLPLKWVSLSLTECAKNIITDKKKKNLHFLLFTHSEVIYCIPCNVKKMNFLSCYGNKYTQLFTAHLLSCCAKEPFGTQILF